jgi:hypothetical protein
MPSFFIQREDRAMLCPVCEASCGDVLSYCRRCGADVTIASTTVVPLKPALPVVPERPIRALIPAPVKTGAGLVALGLGYEIVRLGLRFLLKHPLGRALPALTSLPTLGNRINLPGTDGARNSTPRLPKGYQVTETVYYIHRVISPKR